MFIVVSASVYAGKNDFSVIKNGPAFDTTKSKSFLDFTALKRNIIETLTPEHFRYSILLGIPVEDIYDVHLFQFVTDWYKTKYKFGGASKSGTDCSGFMQQLYKQVYAFPLARVVPEQFGQCTPLTREQLRPGDLVFFHTTRKGLSHVGMYLGNNKFVHSGTRTGVTIDDLNDPYYKKTFRAGGRVKI